MKAALRTVVVHVMPRAGLRDPQGRAVAEALRALGFDGVNTTRIGRRIEIALDAASDEEARAQAQAMCERLLANPTIETWALEAPAS